MNSNKRGKDFENAVCNELRQLAAAHPGFVELREQPEVPLLDGRIRKPDFELIYRTEQEHRELIECQSRNRSSFEVADKIKTVKMLSPRNRFIFIFEDLDALGAKYKKALSDDGVPCLSIEDFRKKLSQIDAVVRAMQHRLRQKEGWEATMIGLLEGATNPECTVPLKALVALLDRYHVLYGNTELYTSLKDRLHEAPVPGEGNEDNVETARVTMQAGQLYTGPSLLEEQLRVALKQFITRSAA